MTKYKSKRQSQSKFYKAWYAHTTKEKRQPVSFWKPKLLVLAKSLPPLIKTNFITRMGQTFPPKGRKVYHIKVLPYEHATDICQYILCPNIFFNATTLLPTQVHAHTLTKLILQQNVTIIMSVAYSFWPTADEPWPLLFPTKALVMWELQYNKWHVDVAL